MMKKFTYIGATKPRIPVNSFCTSLYKKDGEYYIDNVIDNKINQFYKLNSENILIIYSNNLKPRKVDIGDKPIYSYLNQDGELFSGDFFELKPILLPLLNDEKILPTAKLLISSFLDIHYSTEKYIEQTYGFLKNNEFDFVNTQFISSEIDEIDEIDELKKYEQFISKSNPENIVDYFVFKDEIVPVYEETESQSSKVFLHFKNKKISMENIENFLVEEKKGTWMLKFLGNYYDSPNFQQRLNNNIIIYNKLLFNTHNFLNEDSLIKAISPTIKENPNYLDNIKESESIWHLKSTIEADLTSQLSSSMLNDFSENNDQEQYFFSIMETVFSIPDKINTLLPNKNGTRN